MKKFLLSLLAVTLSFGLSAQELVDVLTAKECFGGISYTVQKTYTSPTTGARYIAKASSNNGFQVRSSKAGTGLSVNEAPDGYEIKSIALEFGTAGGGVSVYTADSELILTSVADKGTLLESGVKTNTTFEDVNKPYFAFIPTNDTYCVVSKVTVTWAPVGGPVKTKATLSWSTDSDVITVGDQFTAPTLSSDVAEALNSVVYHSSNEELLQVDENGNMTLVDGAVGTAEISATIPSTDENYTSNTAIYTLTVKKAPVAGEDSYTITFNKAATDGTSALTASAFDAQIAGGKEYYASATSPTNVYEGNVGLKFSSSKNNGSVTINLSDAGKVNATSIVVSASKYGSDAAKLSVNGSAAQNINVDFNDYEFEVSDPAELTSITLAATKRLYVESITVKYASGSTPGPTKKEHGLAFEQSVMEVEVDYDGEGVTLSNPNGLDDVVYSSSNTDIADVDSKDGSILAYAPGTTTITATTEGNDEFKGGSVSYTLTVIAKYDNFFDIVTGNLKKDDKIVAVGDFEVIYHSGANTIVTDGVSNILIYDYNVTSEAGTKVSKVAGTVSPYNGLFELVSATLTEGGEGAEIAPVVLTSFKSVNYDNMLFDLIEVKNATISGVSGKQGTLNLNGETIAMYNNFNIDGYANTEAGATVTVQGFVWRNNDNLQIDPISIVVEQGEKIDAQLAWSVEEFDAVEDTEYTEGLPVLTNDLGIEVVYTSTDENVAYYADGVLLTDAPGTAVITATPKDTEKYFGSASFTVNVAAKPHLGAITVNGQPVADGEVVNVIVNTEVVIAAENAELIAYEIVDPADETAKDIAEAAFYTFTPSAIGEYTVAITATGCGEKSDEIIFTINVTEAPAITEETLDFMKNTYGMERLSGNTKEYNPDNFVLKETEFTYTVSSGTRLWSDGLRMYNNGKITATAPLGYLIESIELWNKNGASGVNNVETSIALNEVSATVAYTSASSNSAISKMRVVIKPYEGETPEVEGYSPELVYNDNVITATDEKTGAITVIITHADKNASIYFKHTPDEAAPAELRRRVVSHEGYDVADATLHEDGNQSVHTFTVPSAGTVDYYAYHAATDTKGEVKRISVSASGEVTSISELLVDTDAADSAVYDLQGRRVAKPAHGLYITNGRKVYLR